MYCTRCRISLPQDARYCKGCGQQLGEIGEGEKSGAGHGADANSSTDLCNRQEITERLLDAAPTIVLLLNTDGRIQYINGFMERLSGYSLNEVRGKDWFSTFLPTSDIQSFQSLFASALSDSSIRGRRNIVVTRDGQMRAIEWYDGQLRDAADQVPGLLLFGQDVTEHMHAEEALLRNTRRHHNLIQNSAEAMALHDAESRILYQSPSVLHILGYEQDEMVGYFATDFCHPDDLSRGLEFLARVLAAPDEIVRTELRCRCKNGSYRRLEVIAVNQLADPVVNAIVANYSDVTERRQAAEALHEISQRYELVIQGSNEGIWDINLATGEAYVSERFGELTGYETAVLSRGLDVWLDLIHPDDRTFVAERIRRHLIDRETYDIRFRMRVSSGAYRWFHSRGQATWNEQGKPLRFVGCSADVTEQISAEELLRISEERLRQAVRVTQIGIFDHDRRTDSLYLSPELRDIFSLDTDAPVMLTDYLRCVHPEDRKAVDVKVDAALAPDGSGRFDAEYRIVRTDGEMRWVAVRSQTFFEIDESGDSLRPVRTIGAVLDQTERKHGELQLVEAHQVAEAALQRLTIATRQAEQFQRLCEFAGQGIGMALMDGTITYLNPALRRLLELPPEENSTPHSFFDFVSTENHAFFSEVVLATVKRHGSWVGELDLLTSTGKLLPIINNVFLMRDSHGEIVGYANIATDISDRKRAEEQMSSLKTQLAHAGRLGVMGEMAAGLAHELNQPLAAIHLDAVTAQQLVLKGDSANLETCLKRLGEQSLRAGEIVRRMWTFVRRSPAQRLRVDLNALIREVLQMLSSDLRHQRVTVTSHLDESLPAVTVDAIQIQQVLINLLRNAVESMTDGSGIRHLEIRTGMVNGGVHVTIADTGPGIAPVVAGKLFHPFQSTKPTGLGLGLAICRTLVEAHGGEIDAYPNPVGGTVFHFVLPQTVN